MTAPEWKAKFDKQSENFDVIYVPSSEWLQISALMDEMANALEYHSECELNKYSRDTVAQEALEKYQKGPSG